MLQLGTERMAMHRRNLMWCIIGMPISAPFAIVPMQVASFFRSSEGCFGCLFSCGFGRRSFHVKRERKREGEIYLKKRFYRGKKEERTEIEREGAFRDLKSLFCPSVTNNCTTAQNTQYTVLLSSF